VSLWPVHTGNKVDRIGNNVERIGNTVDRISNNVERIGNTVDRISNSRLCCRFRQQSTFNRVDGVEFNFVASVYRALETSCRHHETVSNNQ